MATFIKGIIGGDEFLTEVLIRGLTFNGPVDNYYVGNFTEQFGGQLENKYGVHFVKKLEDFIPSAALLFLTFEPYETEKILARIAPKVAPTTLIVSAVRELKLKKLAETFPDNEIIRLFITPSIISGRGLGAYVMSKNATINAQSVAHVILNNCGDVVSVDNEREFDQLADFLTANTYISYVVIQSMIKRARKLGINISDAKWIVEKLFAGSVYSLIDSDAEVSAILRRGTLDEKFRTKVTNLIEMQGIKAELEKFIEKPAYGELIEAEEEAKLAEGSKGEISLADKFSVRPPAASNPPSETKTEKLPVNFRWLYEK